MTAGLIEIDASPRQADAVVIDIDRDDPGATVYDLFVISYG